ncbi:unnamed protein product, partial [Mesorhabditis spiculigera]
MVQRKLYADTPYAKTGPFRNRGLGYVDVEFPSEHDLDAHLRDMRVFIQANLPPPGHVKPEYPEAAPQPGS